MSQIPRTFKEKRRFWLSHLEAWRDSGLSMAAYARQEQVTKSQFKAKALEYFRKVETFGESVVVTDRGQPTVEIRRYRSDKRSPLERLRGSVLEFKNPTEPVAEDDWEALN